MAKDFETSRPIYMQIVDQIFQEIARGEIRPAEKLPSVREMAIQSGVNPNTIQRSYAEMERMGIVETKRGQGTFIVDSESIVEELQASMQQEIIEQFVTSMKELGLTREQMLMSLQKYLNEGESNDDSLS